MDVLDRIETAFPDRGVPGESALVEFDGFDVLDKASAIARFSGRTRAQVGEVAGSEGMSEIEDLSVLEPAALHYYLPPYLRQLVLTEYSEPDELSFWLGYFLCEAVRIRGPVMFTGTQQAVLNEISLHLRANTLDSGDWSEGIRCHWSRLSALLGHG